LILGLVLRFALHANQANGINVHLIGDILLAVSAAIIIVALVTGGAIARAFRG
jgi:hypothetical protein